MTAEIAIMNKQAVALAADSAITYGPKIYNSANKLFVLSTKAPVGIMIYNNAEFLGVPWETLIKYYRNNILVDKRYDSLENYVKDFLRFIQTSNEFFPLKIQRKEFERNIYEKLTHIRKKALQNIKERFEAKKKDESIDKSQINQIITETIDEIHKYLSGLDNLPNVSKIVIAKIRTSYGKIIRDNIKSIFSFVRISNTVKKQLEDISIFVVTKGVVPDYSGIVIAGFGEKEIFPNLYCFHVISKLNGRLFVEEVQSINVNHDNAAFIRPFAQDEMPKTFMEGIDPTQREHIMSTIQENILYNYNESVIDFISHEISTKGINNFNLKALENKLEAFTKDVNTELEQDWQDYRQHEHVNPVMEAVGALPIDELASMAESLINLTSLKRKMSLNQMETVGGPIDVAVISKEDGFIWINRKHYFKPELNYQYFARKNLQIRGA